MRLCGSCNVCCGVFAVPELRKLDFERCRHLRDDAISGGCAIYEARPKTCRVFKCLWLWNDHGIEFPESMRPDRSGIVFTYLFAAETLHGKTIRDYVAANGDGPCAIEVWPGSASKPSSVFFVAGLARTHNVYVATRESIGFIEKGTTL